MNIRFYLKSPYVDNIPTPLFATISYNNKAVKVYPGESILHKYWNPATQSARKNFPESPEFNQRLNNFRTKVGRIFRDYRNNNNDDFPSETELKSLIKGSSSKTGTAQPTFLSYFNEFNKRVKEGKRINHRDPDKKPVGKGITRGYKTTYNHLRDYMSKQNPKLDFHSIDLDFHKDFTEYLEKTLNLKRNTVGSHFRRITTVLNEATEKGVNKYTGYKQRAFVKVSEDSDNIYLNESELREMAELKLTQRLDTVRDWFLIGCCTALRVNDLLKLAPGSITGAFIRVPTKKTNKTVVIPIHNVFKGILAKRNGQFPQSITPEEMNRCLKEIGKLMPSMQEDFAKTFEKGGVRQTVTYKKWELLTSHTERRSFATNQYLAGTPILTIMAITGHTTEKSFLKYIKMTPTEHAEKLAELWARREMKIA